MVAINNTDKMKQWLSAQRTSANIPEGTMKYAFISTILTDREMEMIGMMFLGNTQAQIGTKFDISKARVSEILKACSKKLCHPKVLKELFSL